MQIASVITGLGLITSVFGALEGGSNTSSSLGYEYGHSDSKVTTDGSTTIGSLSSMATNLTTAVRITLSSEIFGTLPGTALQPEGTATSAVVSETSASLVGITTLSSGGKASTTKSVISTETNEAIGGDYSSHLQNPEVTIRVTSTIMLSGVVSTLIRTIVPTTTQTEGFGEKTVTDTVSALDPTSIYSSGKMNWSTLDWIGNSINTHIIYPSKTTDLTSFNKAEMSTSTVTDVDYTSTSTATIVVTGSKATTTLTMTVGYTSSYTKVRPTMTAGPQCTPLTRYITVGAGHPPFSVDQNKPTQIGSLTTASTSSIKHDNASTVTTELNSGIGAAGTPGYFKGNGTVNGTVNGTATNFVSSSLAQPTQTYSGEAANVMNHNPEVLYAAAALITVIFGWVLN